MAARQRPPLGETLHAPPCLASLVGSSCHCSPPDSQGWSNDPFWCLHAELIVIIFFHAEPRRLDCYGEDGLSCWLDAAGTGNNPSWRGHDGQMGGGNARPGRWSSSDRKSTRLNSSHRCISY